MAVIMRYCTEFGRFGANYVKVRPASCFICASATHSGRRSGCSRAKSEQKLLIRNWRDCVW